MYRRQSPWINPFRMEVSELVYRTCVKCKHIVWIYVVSCVVLQASSNDADTFRKLFTRVSNSRISAITQKFISNFSVDACAESCIRESDFLCKSFDFDNSLKACLLLNVNVDDRDVHLIDSASKDHYETVYTKLFNRLPSHRLPVVTDRAVVGVSAEGCARHCIMETRFKCRGFNYRKLDERCMLVEETPSTSTGAIFSQDVDYYRKSPDGAIAEFINLGMGRMRPLPNGQVHQSGQRGLTLEQCAQRCLDESSFDCLSFDYVFEGMSSDCYLSKYIAANIGGLVIDTTMNVQYNHFEKIGPSLLYFYATPYAAIPGNNLKTYDHVTPNRCARHCLEEEAFVCRSFDYRITDAMCMLSDKAGSDVGGIVTEGGFEGDVHHFEMKPILDCGGNLTASEGNIASPNWPRDYAHHHACTWRITTSQYKVIHLKFSHFELGRQSSDPCSTEDDRLVITENTKEPYCVRPKTKVIQTKSNEIRLDFLTNGHVDAQGFRMFYTTEWTCNENLIKPGEFASPKWPENYPSGSKCSWKIIAPPDKRIVLYFTVFQLEQHSLGHCNEKLDHVKILDGGTANSAPIGLYCGILLPFSVRSTGQDLFVQFVSDYDPENTRLGFHAKFVFEARNDTIFDMAGPSFKGNGKLDEDNSLDSEEGKVGAHVGDGDATGDETIPLSEHHQYKKTMWAVVTFLLLMLVAACVGLFLVYRHFRGRLDREQEIIEQDGSMIPLKDIPQTNLRNIRPNNDCEMAMNASETDALSDGAELGAMALPLGDVGDCKPNNLQLGKYAKENIKNINVDQKNYDA